MRKLVVGLMALLMVVSTGCSVEWKGDQPLSVGEIVRQDGTLRINDFDATTVNRFLDATTEVKDYHIIINTGGGNAFNILTMINRLQDLQSQGAHITTEIIGYGLSAGTYLFLAGDTRIVHEGAILMFHGAGSVVFGVRTDKQDVCKENDKGEIDQPAACKVYTMLDDNFANLMREKTGMGAAAAEKWLYEYSYNFMSAKDALWWGVATEIK